jgi:hypothetical protein
MIFRNGCLWSGCLSPERWNAEFIRLESPDLSGDQVIVLSQLLFMAKKPENAVVKRVIARVPFMCNENVSRSSGLS